MVYYFVIFVQAIESFETLLSNAVSIRKGIVSNLLERANQKKAEQDLKENSPQPVCVYQYLYFDVKKF